MSTNFRQNHKINRKFTKQEHFDNRHEQQRSWYYFLLQHVTNVATNPKELAVIAGTIYPDNVNMLINAFR